MNANEPGQQGLYDPWFEHDACGVGFVVDLKNRKSHDIVQKGLQILLNLQHRGACGCEANTGDGAGILLQMPHKFFKEECERLDIELPAPGSYGVGMVYLPQDASDRGRCEQLFEKIAPYQGFLGVALLFWGLYDLYRWMIQDTGLGKSAFSIFLEFDKVLAFSGLAYLISEVIIGFILGFGLIASWIPGEGGAEKKGLAIQKKLLTFSLPIGIIGMISAVIVLIKFP